MVILSPGKYTVDRRWRAITSSGSPRRMPSAGAAIWMPMRSLPSGSFVTDSASSISVVVTSSIENASTSASGRSAGGSGTSVSGKAVPLGKHSARNLASCSARALATPPTVTISRIGVMPSAVQAASMALYSRLFLSGLNSSCSTLLRNDSGSVSALSCSSYSACTSACWRLRSSAASAALSWSSGARW
ncbi:hypothetical protein FQZ97_897440 [compost metagenome]